MLDPSPEMTPKSREIVGTIKEIGGESELALWDGTLLNSRRAGQAERRQQGADRRTALTYNLMRAIRMGWL